MGEKRANSILEENAQKAISLIKSSPIYFAHPVNYYIGSNFNTHGNIEKELIKIIQKNFPNNSVYNPNQTHNQENYKIWKEMTGSGMKYFFDIILPHMVGGVGLSFEDGMFGAGVFGELEYLLKNNKPIYEIDKMGLIFPIKNLDYSKKLSIEETQKRVYKK